MMKHIHILPVTVLSLILVSGLKLSTVWSEAQGLMVDVAVPTALANEAKPAEKPAEGEVKDKAAAHDEKANGEKNPNVATEKPVEKAPVVAGLPSTGSQFSAGEVEVLERLADRRAELDRRSKALDMRDNLLKATETRIDGKISKLKEMQQTLDNLLKEYDKQESAQLESLVKIYEKMKPKDAARIFNNLDMDILINVASKIKESKMAAILANMNSQQANKLTVELATRRQLPGEEKNKG